MRLFVAVWPPADVVARLGALERPAGDGVRWTTPDQWHVTVRFLGGLDDPGPVSERLGARALPAALAVAGPASECPTARLLWLPVAGLDALAATVRAVTADIGQPPEEDFRGHLTLARARRGAARGALRGLAPLGCDASWEVDEVTVVASTLGPGGSRYEVVDRIALA